MLARLAIGATLVALLVGVGARSALADTPQGLARGFAAPCAVENLTAGREGDAWFTCSYNSKPKHGSRVRIGHVTAAGTVSEFGAGVPADFERGASIALGPSGDLWVPLDAYHKLKGGKRPAPRLAQISPDGQLVSYPIPLGRAYDIERLAATPGGYLFFTTSTGREREPTLWQRAPDGTISKLPIKIEKPYLELEAAPEGNLWFARETVPGATTRTLVRVAPGGATSEFAIGAPKYLPSPLAHGSDGSTWFSSPGDSLGVGRVTATGEVLDTGAKIDPTGTVGGATVGADGNLWFGTQGGVASAIYRVTPAGEVATYQDCLRYGQPFFGPVTMVDGADGAIYFTSIASRELPNISDPPSIGRVTRTGEITQLYAGVDGEADQIAAGSDGGVWFSAGGKEVERIAPITGPVNTFRVARLERGSATGAANASVQVPGPGTVSLKPLAFLPRHHKPVPIGAPAVTVTSAACGSVSLPVAPVGAAKSAFHKRGFADERVAVTFTPTGGTSYTETATLYFDGGKAHEHRPRHPKPPPPGKHRGEPLRVPQADESFPIRPSVLRFAYQPPGSYGDEEPAGSPVYPPFSLTGLGHWEEWHKREERNGVPARAISDGFIHYDTCDPSCAHGRYAVARARVELDGEFLCTKGPKRIFETFERITVRVEGGPPRTRFIQCTGHLRSGKRSQVIPPGVGFYRR